MKQIHVLILILFMLLSTTLLTADYAIDFEAESKSTYTAGDITLNGLQWNMNESLIGNLANDKKNGSKSARFRHTASMTMLENKTGGIGTISLNYAKYGTDTIAPVFQVDYSTNDGVSWLPAGTTFDSNTQSSLTAWSVTIDVSGDVRVRITTISGTAGKRGNIDDILMTDYNADYYNGSDGLSGAALRVFLHNLIDNHTSTTYNWDVVGVDEDPDNSSNVLLIYTGRSMAKEPHGDAGNWNREHVWPQSHGCDLYPMRSDLHHLRACDSHVNSTRGEKDFNDCPGGTDVWDSGDFAGTYLGDSWEPPDHAKGDIARMVFYMDVRYEGDSGEPNLEIQDFVGTGVNQLGMLSALWTWHNNDPVSTFETIRNERVYALQGNRNPFIDYPEFANAIWGGSLLANPAILNFSDTETGTDSAVQSYTLTGDNLSANVSVTAPPGFEVSLTSDSGFGGLVLVIQTGGSVNNTVYVRFSPSLAIDYMDNVTNVSGYANESVTVSGRGYLPTGNTPQPGDVYISEVSDNDTGGYTTAFMELYNSTGDAIDMGGATIQRWQGGLYNSFTYSIPAGTLIPANGFLIIARGCTEGEFETAWGVNLSASNSNFDSGSNNLYFTTGRSYQLHYGRALLDQTQRDIPANERDVQMTPGSWTTGDTPANANPGANDAGQTLAVTLSSFNATVIGNNSVDICWSVHSENGLSGYRLYRGTTSIFDEAADMNVLIPATNSSYTHDYSYSDEEVEQKRTYSYWLEANEYSGVTSMYGPVFATIVGDEEGIPDFIPTTQLKSLYPNPFNPSTTVSFSLKGHRNQMVEVSLKIFNARGQVIRNLISGSYPAGDNLQQNWNGTDNNGNTVAGGVYLFQLTTSDSRTVKKAVLLK
ncbi:MAG: endonuclease [Candidatus Cloacimonetes bacterium]|nr:endonuclease [Candidatus Cloacimonadota bacterium]